jgi:hypothetical protein
MRLPYNALTERLHLSHTLRYRKNGLKVRRRYVFAALLVFLTLPSLALASADPTEVTHAYVRSGDTLAISCTRPAIQNVYIHGNLSQVKFDAPNVYPTSNISLLAMAPGSLDLTITFQHSEDYRIQITAQTKSGNVRDLDNFYLSNGAFSLKIDVSISAPETKKSEFQMPSAKDFSSWLVNFGEAFPLWTKLLYLFLGFQFLFVGYERIVLDDQLRRERKLRSLDLGNKIYVSIDVICKFLLTCLAMTAVLMIGEVIVLEMLRLVFLATVDLPSIWNLFVLAFVAVLTLSAYLFRIVLRHTFDLQPTEVD